MTFWYISLSDEISRNLTAFTSINDLHGNMSIAQHTIYIISGGRFLDIELQLVVYGNQLSHIQGAIGYYFMRAIFYLWISINILKTKLEVTSHGLSENYAKLVN